MFVVLALASAALYGAADFIGGFISRRADSLVVVVVSQASGLVVVALAVPFLGPAVPSQSDWMWGVIAGLTGGAGVALLYRALAVGVMAVVAPLTAVCAVAVPVIIAVVLGERPGLQASVGIALAVVAIVLVSQGDAAVPHGANATTGRRGVGLALAAGLAIGLFFLALARTRSEAGLWPLVTARGVAIAIFGGLTLTSRRSYAMPASVMATAAGGGVVDMLANLLYMLATRHGPLTLVVTLASLYPASTVLLAWVVAGERITSRQWIGVACALFAIAFIVSSG